MTFGVNAASSFTVDSDTQITAPTPAGTGQVNVTVTNPNGQSGTLVSAFNYRKN